MVEILSPNRSDQSLYELCLQDNQNGRFLCVSLAISRSKSNVTCGVIARAELRLRRLVSQRGYLSARLRGIEGPEGDSAQDRDSQQVSSRRTAFIMMMQTTNLVEFKYLTFPFRLRTTAIRCVFVERQVSSPAMVIAAVASQRADE